MGCDVTAKDRSQYYGPQTEGGGVSWKKSEGKTVLGEKKDITGRHLEG